MTDANISCNWTVLAIPTVESLISRDMFEVLVDIPHGDGENHADGLSVFVHAHDASTLLVVYNNAAQGRKRGNEGVLEDVFACS